MRETRGFASARDALFAPGATYAERVRVALDALRRANDGEEMSPAESDVEACVAWTRAAVRLAGGMSGGGNSGERARTLGDDAPSGEAMCEDDELWEAFVLGCRASGGGQVDAGGASAAARALTRAAAGGGSDETLTRAFEALANEGGGGNVGVFRASCERCVDVARACMESAVGRERLTRAALTTAAHAAHARPNKPAPASVDFEFLWGVVRVWSERIERRGDEATRVACESAMRAFILHPMYARAIPNLVTDANAGAKRQRTDATTAEGATKTSATARSSVPAFICDIVDRIARAAESVDVDALRLAPWLLRAALDADDSAGTSSSMSRAISEDARSLFIGIFEPIAAVFLARGGKSKGREESTAASEALTAALAGSLLVAIDHKLYSPMDDGKVEGVVRAFVENIASSATRDDDRSLGWARVIRTVTELDSRLIEPHAESMLTILLVKSRDVESERVEVMRSLTKSFADMRRMPDFMLALGQAFANANACGAVMDSAVISRGVLDGFQKAAMAVPLAQTPELMVACRDIFINAYEAEVAEEILDKLSRIVQNVLGTCPDNPGEPMIPEARECLEGFTVDITERLQTVDSISADRAGSLLRAYVPVYSLLRGLGDTADLAARTSYFRCDAVNLSAIVNKLVRDDPKSKPASEAAEAAAVGCALQRVKTVSRLRCPRGDVTPDEAAVAGREIKSLLSACFRMVPDTSRGTTYDAPDAKAEAWEVFTSTVHLWYEHATEAQLLDYYQCRLETDTEGGALSEEEEKKFGELIVTFKPWVRAIANVMLRGAADLTSELLVSEPTASVGLCHVLDDVVSACSESTRDPAGTREVFSRFWEAANSSLASKGESLRSGRAGVDTLAVKRMRRAMEAVERMHSRAVASMDKGVLSTATQACNCASFAAAVYGVPSGMDLCVRARLISTFLATNDEDAAAMSANVTSKTPHYLEATIRVADAVCDAETSKRLFTSTTSEFYASLVGSALKAKSSVYARVVSLVSSALDEHLHAATFAISPGSELASFLAESVFAAGPMVYLEPEREKFGWVQGNPNLRDEEIELRDEDGEVLANYWDATARVRERIEMILREVEGGAIVIDVSTIEVVSTCVSAVGYALGISATTLDYGEKFHRTLEPEFIQIALSIATRLLLRSASMLSAKAASRIVDFLGAACDSLKQTGPQLTPEAHASLVAVVMSTYTHGTQVAVDQEGAKNASPLPELREALDLTLQELIYGAGKRPLNAIYTACMDAFKSIDAEARRAHVLSDRLDVALSAPVWALSHLVGAFHFGKALRSAAQENIEELMDACARVLSVAVKVPNANSIVIKILEIVTEFSRLGARCEMSTRCVSRLCQLPSFACAADVVIDDESSSTAIFAQSCELLGALLKARRDHLRRAVSNVTMACSEALASLRRRRALGASDEVMTACARKLSYVYEAAESSGLDRYCTHLLADAITAITGGGIGPAAEASLRPGIFALLDACGDRELQQLHAALGAGAGGARRVVFSTLREQHKLTHKFDGRV